MDIGKRIAASRKKAGLSQEALAEKLGVSRQAVSRWETGETMPELEKCIALCRALGVSADLLLLGEEQPAAPGGAQTETDEAARRRVKTRFRIAVILSVLALGVILTAFALLSALAETYQPYQEWYTDLGPYATYLFTTWRFGVFVSGLACIAGCSALLCREYRRL